MLSNSSSVDGTYIFYCCNKQWRQRKRHQWHSEKHQEESYLRFVTWRKQSCCKVKMLSSYTSLLKKLSNFPNALTGTKFLLHQEEWYLRYVTCCMTKKKYLALFKALITVGLLFTWILQYRLSIPEKWKAKQLYKNFVRDFYIFRVIKKFVSTA